jgi:hypothetical protein
MKKYIIISLLILALGTPSLAAQVKENKNVVFRLSLLSPGGGMEFGLKDNFSFLAQGGVGINIESKDEFKVKFPLYAFISPRYYYNLNKRKEQGKRVDKFAANYVGVIIGHVFKATDIDQWTFIGPIWGLQRNIGKTGYFDFNIGLEVLFLEDKTAFGGQLGFALGFAF